MALPELQKRKEQLKKIREMKGAPLNKTDILQHEQWYETKVRKRMAELEEERMRKVANVDYDPSKFQNRISQKVHQEDEEKRKQYFEKEHQKKLLAEKLKTYGEFVNKVHKPVISEKKKAEMDSIIEKLKHPVKETKKIPSSASYHDLYNTNGKNPWASTSVLHKSTTPTNKLHKHSFLAGGNSRSQSRIKEMSSKKNRSKLTLNTHENRDNGSNDSTNLELPNTEIGQTQLSALNDRTNQSGPPKKLIISKKKPHHPVSSKKYKPSPKRLKLPKRGKYQKHLRNEVKNITR